MTTYHRPLVQQDAIRAPGAVSLAGGPFWFTHAERIRRGATTEIVPAAQIPPGALDLLTAPRESLAGLDMRQPQIMGILNVTPDSFSDGGKHDGLQSAVAAGHAMIKAGAAILDIGGESTRPGAEMVPQDLEIQRTAPVIAALRRDTTVPISIDTRKSQVAGAALEAGATLVNDVSGFTFDPDLARVCADASAPVCVMHAQGDPETMQKDPSYDSVLLDVYDVLNAQVDALIRAGIPRAQIAVDPGIGFGKTIAHNLALLRGLSLFHGLGCVLLLGVSRKRFIGAIGQAPEASARAPGSIALGLAALDQGVQILRVHDVGETVQAVRLWAALRQR